MDTLTIYKGDTVEEIVQLRKKNKCTDVCNNYPLPSGTKVVLSFPGEDQSVTISSDDGEVDIIDYSLSTLSFKLSPTKSILLKTGKKQELDVIVTLAGTGSVKTAEIVDILDIYDRANVLP